MEINEFWNRKGVFLNVGRMIFLYLLLEGFFGYFLERGEELLVFDFYMDGFFYFDLGLVLYGEFGLLIEYYGMWEYGFEIFWEFMLDC